MYVREPEMHPELRAILAERDLALGPQAAGTNYIFQFEKLLFSGRVRRRCGVHDARHR
jgi:hypothetical protein